MTDTFANPAVLEFYREMPFNFMESAQDQAEAVRVSNNIGAFYPCLAQHLRKGVSTLDVGCGTGWFVHMLSYYYQTCSQGLDFNPVAVARAQETAALLNIQADFAVADLFTHVPKQPYDVVTSLGVLHHTDNCHAAIRVCAERFLAPDGVFFLGLYHSYGRKPFLDYFAELKRQGADEEALFKAYAKLKPNDEAPETFLRSWFRDQVLHPHETQHSLFEIAQLLKECDLKLESTSINGFAPFDDEAALFELEKTFYDRGLQKLERSEYFPGFFVVLARKS